MTETASKRAAAAAVAAAPSMLLFGFVYHPYVSVATDAEAIGRAVTADTTRWGVAHLVIALGYALLALALLAVRAFLAEHGEQRWTPYGLPLAVFGSALFVILPGMELAPLAAAETGGDVEAAQEELAPWFIPMFVLAALTFSLGIAAYAIGIARRGALSPGVTRVVVAALVVMVLARFVPLGSSQIVIGVAAVVAFWPLAAQMWTQATTARESRPASEGGG